MVPFLTSPLALFALAAVPALVAIYLFQRRFRNLDVSSLVLWDAVRPPSGGGRRREPVRLPLTFWLEALAVVLLALAAAGPFLARWAASRPLVIVADDSLSMRAGARDRARTFVERELKRRRYDPVRVIFAGTTPQAGALEQWTCSAPVGDLDAAIAMASQVAGPSGLILVLTDRAPDRTLDAGRIRWESFGAKTPNAGFVGATRSGERVILEIANFGDADATTQLAVTHQPNTSLTIPAHAQKRVQLTLPRGAGAIDASIAGDAATFDDRVTLLPDTRRPLRVDVRIADASLRSLFTNTLQATNRVTFDSGNPELVIGADGFRVDATPNGAAFIGPYVIDRTHPLTAGLALDGVVWGAARGPLAGTPIVMVGSQPLLTDTAMRFDPSISTLHRSPAWPALLWNLVEWRSAQLPGPRPANVTLGADVQVRLASPGVASVESPDQVRREADGRSGTVVVGASMPGIWRVRAGAETHAFAVNVFVPSESDLSNARTGSWGEWNEEALAAGGYQDAAWLLLLLALATLAFHQRVTAGEAA
jgi:Aerotolerance regulator N-terminal